MRTFFSMALLGLALISGIHASNPDSQKLYSWDFISGTMQTNAGTFSLAVPQSGDIFRLFYKNQSDQEIKSFEIVFPDIDSSLIDNQGRFGGSISHPQAFAGNLGGNTRLEYNKDAAASAVTVSLVGSAITGPSINIGEPGTQIQDTPNVSFGSINANAPIDGDIAFASNCSVSGDLFVAANGGVSVGGTVSLTGKVIGNTHIHGGVDGFLDVDHIGQYAEIGEVGDYAHISSVNSNLNVEQNVGGHLNINSVQDLNIATISGNASINQIGTLTIEGNNASVGKIENRGGAINEINNSGTVVHLSNAGTITTFEDTSDATMDTMKTNATINILQVNSTPNQVTLNQGAQTLTINGNSIGTLNNYSSVTSLNSSGPIGTFNSNGSISTFNNQSTISALQNNAVIQNITNSDGSHTAMIGTFLNQAGGFVGTLNNKNGTIANSNVRPTGFVPQNPS